MPAALVPQTGSMCLLDEVTRWDETRVTCTSASHRRCDHPLRRDGHLEALHLLEYAAQATAVHAALTAPADGDHAPARVLAAVRDFDVHLTRLDDVHADLHIDAERLIAMGDSVIYGFRVTAGDRLLAHGRLSVAAPVGTTS
jgi:predicted hotdog family 3-hydroxylacyl-ACP dehydratase